MRARARARHHDRAGARAFQNGDVYLAQITRLKKGVPTNHHTEDFLKKMR